MQNSLITKIILPSKVILEAEVNMVNLPGTEGVFGVLPGHSKFTATIDIGIVTLFVNNKELRYFVHGGVAQAAGNELNIISEFAEDLSKATNSTINNDIKKLEKNLSKPEIEPLEVDILKNNIQRYKTLLKFL